MATSNAIWIWFLILFFSIIGFVMPFIALEFGGTIAHFSVESLGQATGLGIVNALTSVLGWTFGVNIWLNIIIFTPLRITLWYILLTDFADALGGIFSGLGRIFGL